MRVMMFAAALLLMGLQPAGAAPAAEKFWTASADRLGFEPAGLSVPRRAGPVEYFETTEFSHPGEGLDTALKYRSRDREVVATLYVYFPSVAHTGVHAIATDQAIRLNSQVPVGIGRVGVTAAGGKPGVAQTADYKNYLGKYSSKAAFIKLGGWIVKIRVSGPEPRSAEVEAAMDALLAGLRFEGKSQPVAAMPITTTDCAHSSRKEARLLADDDVGVVGGTLATFDAAGVIPAKERGKPALIVPRIGPAWCRDVLRVGDKLYSILEATDPASKGRGLGAKSEFFVLFGDSGGMLEIVRMRNSGQFILLGHEIGQVKVFGAFDALPSRSQIGQLLQDPGEAGRPRALVKLRPNRGAEIQLPTSAAEKPRSPR